MNDLHTPGEKLERDLVDSELYANCTKQENFAMRTDASPAVLLHCLGIATVTS